MFTPDQVRIISQEEDARYVEGAAAYRYIRVRFRVGSQGPFQQEFPREGYTAAARDAKLQAFAREVWVEPQPAA